jgi:hypothetical protein
MRTCMGNLSLYTLSDKGNQFTDDDTNERVLLPQYLQALDQVKEENRPRLTRDFMGLKQLPFEDSVMERRSLKAARL